MWSFTLLRTDVFESERRGIEKQNINKLGEV
jgi:hypothetical protein